MDPGPLAEVAGIFKPGHEAGQMPCWICRWPKCQGFQSLEGLAGTAGLFCCHGAARGGNPAPSHRCGLPQGAGVGGLQCPRYGFTALLLKPSIVAE
jgi:hypothetical protein